MSIIDLVNPVETGELNLNDIMAMDSTRFCGICLDDYCNISRCQRVKNGKAFIMTEKGAPVTSETNKRAGVKSPIKQIVIASNTGAVGRRVTIPRGQTEVGPGKLAPTKTLTTLTTDMLCYAVG